MFKLLPMSILLFIFYVLLFDSLVAVFISWSKYKDYFNRFALFKRFMPLTKGWTLWYLILVLFIGYILYFGT